MHDRCFCSPAGAPRARWAVASHAGRSRPSSVLLFSSLHSRSPSHLHGSTYAYTRSVTSTQGHTTITAGMARQAVAQRDVYVNHRQRTHACEIARQGHRRLHAVSELIEQSAARTGIYAQSSGVGAVVGAGNAKLTASSTATLVGPFRERTPGRVGRWLCCWVGRWLCCWVRQGRRTPRVPVDSLWRSAPHG
jgi:hypothetical protein